MLYLTSGQVVKLYETENPIITLIKTGEFIRDSYIYFEEISMAHLARFASYNLFEGDRCLFSFENMFTVVVFEKVAAGWWKLVKFETKRNIPFTIPNKKLAKALYFMYC